LELLGLVYKLFGLLVQFVPLRGPFAGFSVQLAATILIIDGLLLQPGLLFFQFCQHPPFVLLFQPPGLVLRPFPTALSCVGRHKRYMLVRSTSPGGDPSKISTLVFILSSSQPGSARLLESRPPSSSM